MAAVGAEVTGSWFLLSGPVGFFILLLFLSVYLTALCSDCRRRSFELRDPETDRNPSGLVRVVKLEDAMGARENPMIDDIQKDEAAVGEDAASFTPWRSHLGAPLDHQGVHTNGSAAVMMSTGDSETEENTVQVTPWRSHLMAPQSRDWLSSTSPDPAPFYHVIGGGRSSSGGDADASSPRTNQEAEEQHSVVAVDKNSVYARVSKKERLTTPPAEEEQEEEEEEEEASPPLPDRET